MAKAGMPLLLSDTLRSGESDASQFFVFWSHESGVLLKRASFDAGNPLFSESSCPTSWKPCALLA
jgi:hypothetical protein